MTFVAIAVALACAVVMIVWVPPVEAPDEHGHTAYVDWLLAGHGLPDVDDPTSGPTYEAWQPPLAYVVTAAVLRAGGVQRISPRLRLDPAFAFQRGRRAFLPAEPTDESRAVARGLRLARATNLSWLVVAVVSIVATCRGLGVSPRVACAAGLPFALSPQILFAGSTVGNDMAVTALAGVATAGIVSMARRTTVLGALATSTFAGLALWTKSSAVLVAPAIAVLLVESRHTSPRRIFPALLLPGLFLTLSWLGLEIHRTGGVLLRPPTGWSGGPGAGRLFSEPWWMVSVWVGFWAKFGWFNLPLPGPAYVAFLLPTGLAVLGAERSWRAGDPCRPGRLLTAIVATNVVLLVLYLVGIDWQPQGRYLLPSSAALAGLAALGLERIGRTLPAPRFEALCWLASIVAVGTALGSAAFLRVVYA